VKHEAVAVVNGRVLGRFGQRADGRYVLRYHDAWRHAEGAFPLSLSLPLTRAEHPDEAVRPYLWNLLPDNDAIIAAWARRFQVSPTNPLALLFHVGEDCPGALQLLAPDAAEALVSGDRTGDVVEWLTEADIAERLRRVRHEPAAWREPDDPGQFSLAGAQPKIALLREGDRWGIPSGRIPTTHILKPPVQRQFDGFAENEHVCLRLADCVGLPAVRSELRWFEDEVAVVVERFDRVRSGGELLRIPQEDFCQALGRSPRDKYENEGGPTAREMIAVLQQRSLDADEDVATAVGALALNWTIGGTDAHAKNYSLLMHPGGFVRLAPLYDLLSLLPYREGRGPRVKLAMRIGGEYRLRAIDRRSWERLATEIGAEPEAAVAVVRDVVEQVPDALAGVRREAEGEGIRHPILDRLQDEVAAHAAFCLARLAEGAAA
jgi:serine/threonine-protein kinase HipA